MRQISWNYAWTHGRNALLRLFVGGVLGGLGACAGRETFPGVGLNEPTTAGTNASPLAETRWAPATLLTRGAAVGQGPYLLRRTTGTLVVMATPEGSPSGPLFWRGAAFGATGPGTDLGKLTPIAPLPFGLTSTALRPLGAKDALLLWVRPDREEFVLEGVALSGDGRGKGPVKTLVRSATRILWADAVATADGGHVYYATADGDDARVDLIALDGAAQPRRAVIHVADRARTWQPVATSVGSLLAIGQPKSADRPVRITTYAYDARGEPLGAPSNVTAEAIAEPDVDAVSLGDRVVLGWSERSALRTRVRVAVVDARGATLLAPSEPLRSVGDQTLLGLTASDPDPTGRRSVLVAWDDASVRPAQGRRIQLTSLDNTFRMALGAAELRLPHREDNLPPMSGTSGGFVALTTAPACSSPTAACATLVPFYVRWTNDLRVTAAAPLLPQPLKGVAPAFAWGLTCAATSCAALTSDGRSPPVVYAAAVGNLSPRGDPPVVDRKNDAEVPLLIGSATLEGGPPYADMDATELGDRTLVATLTEHTEGAPPPELPAGADAKAEMEKDKAQRAQPHPATRSAIVRVQSVDRHRDNASDHGDGTVLSVRALSVGGVAVAASADHRGAVVAWVGRDSGTPQIFLTRVGADGKRQKQQVFTRTRGDISHVAVTTVDDGWLVLWADGRHGNGELYAAKVDTELRRRSADQRITNAPGDITDIAVWSRQSEVLVAFSDTRGPGGEATATGDTFVIRLAAATGAKINDEVRLGMTPLHTQSLRMASYRDDVLVAWLDVPPPKRALQDRPDVLVARIDASGVPRGKPVSLGLPADITATSLGLTCASDRCRWILGRTEGDGLMLSGALWEPGSRQTARFRDIATVSAGAGSDVQPLLLGEMLLLADELPEKEGRLRQLGVRWF